MFWVMHENEVEGSLGLPLKWGCVVERINISRIQHFSVGDGAGIRTTVFCKGCNLRCPWCHNPETWLAAPQTLYYEQLGRQECCGVQMEIAEIVREILEDRDFYEESGGGVTISGGEALLQAKAVAALSKALKEERISVLVDTAGCVPYEAFESVLPYVDGVLYDYKSAREEDYRSVIKGEFALVRKNLERLLMDGAKVCVRIPLIPGFNTDEASVRMIGMDLRRLGIKEADLLPFHRMGSGKYKALGWEYPYRNTEPLTKKELEMIQNLLEEFVHTQIE